MATLYKRSGSQAFYVRWFDDQGRAHWRTTGTSNRKQAESIAHTWDKAIAFGRSDTLTPDRAREILATGLEEIFLHSNREKLKTYTVREWGKQWLESKLIENATRTHERYAGIMSRFYDYLGAKADRNIAGVTAAEITAFRDKLAKELSLNTANMAVKTLRVCFGAAYSNDLLTSNTAAKVKKLKTVRNGQRRDFKPAEIRLLLQAAGDSEWRGLILTSLYTAQRLGDVARLRWNQVNLETKEIAFQIGKLRGQPLVLPIAPALADHLETLPSSDDASAFLFPKAAAVTKTGTLSNQFYKVMEQAGLVQPRKNIETGKGHGVARTVNVLSFHSLRHSAVTFLKAAGVSDAVAQAIAGHGSSAVSKIYTHLDTETLRKAVGKIEDVTKGAK